jgi:hypothetical protein
MKKPKLHFAFVLAILFIATESIAQLQLPQPSPKATFTQTVGVTDVTIEYSSPGVKGRNIWGELVPYDELWRAGANQATKVTFSRDVSISGTNVPKGSYSLLMLPVQNGEWTVIFNKNPVASTSAYKQEEDIVRVRVRPETVPHRERLLYLVSDFTENSGNIDMEWEKLRIRVPVTFETDKIAMESINNTFNSFWRQYAAAANYQLNVKKDYDQGLDWINKSIALKEDWYNHWIRAQILREKNMHQEAYKSAQKAKELGDKSENFFFRNQVEEALKNWRKK